MSQELNRKLSVVYFSDIVGYTRLMGRDEDAAFGLMQKNLAAHSEILGKYRGKIIKELGDGILAVFETVSEALSAALEIQEFCKKHKEFELRIGLHYGEVIFDHGDVFGDTVNLASRIQSVGTPSSILISEKVFQNIPISYDFHALKLGAFNLKNVETEIELYALTNPPLAIPKRNEVLQNIKFQDRNQWKYWVGISVVFILATYLIFSIFWQSQDWDREKSVAVLPFENLSENLDQEFFSDGLTADVISQISKVNSLKVISKDAVREYKKDRPSLDKIAETLNVSTILIGSIDWNEEKIRINVRLIDVSKNEDLWEETFDRDSKDIFLVQTEIAREIAKALDANLSVEEQNQIGKAQTSSFSAYEMYLKGRDQYYKYDSATNLLAAETFKKAISIDPNYAMAYTGLADSYAQMSYFGLGMDWLDYSLEASSKALEIDPFLSEAYSSQGSAYYYKGRKDLSQVSFEKALALNPNLSSAIGNLATVYFINGQLDKSLPLQTKSAAINPKNHIPFQIAGWIYRILGNQVEARKWINQSLSILKDPVTYEQYAYSYLSEDSTDKALELVPAIFANGTEPGSRHFEAAGLISFYSKNQAMALKNFQQSLDKNEAYISDPYFPVPIFLAAINENKAEAKKLIDMSIQLRIEAIESGDKDYNLPLYIAMGYMLKNQETDAINSLKQAYELGWRDYFMVENNMVFDSIRQNPEYRKLITIIKKDIDQMNQNLAASAQGSDKKLLRNL
jgi:TolB-like protein/class 3 adenylate cyclase/Flp pilus assembly protein TadD